MTRAKFTLALLLMLPASTVGAGLLPRTSGIGDQSRMAAAAASPEANLQGTWTGTFRSKHTRIAPFTLCVAIDPDMHGRVINKSGITSCLGRDVDLHVIVNGSDAVLAGTDELGNTITFHGTIDKTGKVLTFNYVTNGSASGKCESDDGTANLVKQ
jgi:hypothetical protein